MLKWMGVNTNRMLKVMVEATSHNLSDLLRWRTQNPAPSIDLNFEKRDQKVIYHISGWKTYSQKTHYLYYMSPRFIYYCIV